jgi:hypothetical protein
MTTQRSIDELMPLFRNDVKIEAIDPQESVWRGECDAVCCRL